MTSLPIVLLHGWGMHSGVWPGLPSLLGTGREYCPLDLPGHGQAPFDPSWRALPDWAAACLDQAPERAVWLGWSLGGLVALKAALEAPKRVAALVLMTATPRFTQAADWHAAMAAATLGDFHDALLADPAATLERFLALQVRGSHEARDTLRRLRAALAAGSAPRPEALTIGLDLLAEEDLRGPLPDVRCPALWLFGERDALVPAAVAGRVALLMPGAETLIIPGAAHAPLLSHAEVAATPIKAFLQRIDS